MTVPAVQRHHFLNTIVGVLDSAFYLSEEEQFAVGDIIRQLLIALNIPDRGVPAEIAMPVAQELSGGIYTIGLNSPRESGLPRHVRAVGNGDSVVSLEAWRQALVGLITTSYPDLSADEMLLVTKVMTDLLAVIGVPQRAAAFFPDAVAHAYREIDTAG